MVQASPKRCIIPHSRRIGKAGRVPGLGLWGHRKELARQNGGRLRRVQPRHDGIALRRQPVSQSHPPKNKKSALHGKRIGTCLNHIPDRVHQSLPGSGGADGDQDMEDAVGAHRIGGDGLPPGEGAGIVEIGAGRRIEEERDGCGPTGGDQGKRMGRLAPKGLAMTQPRAPERRQASAEVGEAGKGK
jgi:hypothetical protein